MAKANGIPVSMYNFPLCTVPSDYRAFAVQSISDWKNAFVEECDRCNQKHNCSGFFTTGRPRFSRGISAITSQPSSSFLAAQ